MNPDWGVAFMLTGVLAVILILTGPTLYHDWKESRKKRHLRKT